MMNGEEKIIEWLERREIKLDTPKVAFPIDRIPPEGFETGNYIRVLSLDGTASLRLDTLGAHEFDLTVYTEFKQLFHQVLITHTAQPGKRLILSFGRGDFWFPEVTRIAKPISIQTQLRSVVAHTTTPLGANEPYESDWFDARNYSTITLLAFSNRASAANGLQIQQSIDGVNSDWENHWTLNASTGRAESVELYGRWVRVRLVNGATPQDTFRLMALARVI